MCVREREMLLFVKERGVRILEHPHRLILGLLGYGLCLKKN